MEVFAAELADVRRVAQLLPYSEKGCETYDVTSIEGEANGSVVVSPALDDVPVGVRPKLGWVAE
jgi:hypothetical protein